MRISIVLLLLSLYSYAFAESYVDSKAEFKVPVGQEQQDDATSTNMIKTTPGEEFVIKLDANPTTGYEWQLVQSIDDSLVKFVNSHYVPDMTSLLGSGGKSVWTFKAVRAGKAQISFKYIRPWEKNTPPVKEATYIVSIQD